MSSQKIYGLCGLKHHIVEIRDHVTRRDGQQTNEQGKIGLLSQWKLEAEFRNLTSNLQDPFSQPCSQESHRFSDLPLLSHSAYLRKVFFFTKFWRRRIEDLPNSAIFKLSCRSKHFGFFGKWRLKDTELKCLWSNF